MLFVQCTSGISGLKNFQTKLDVIGNNVANVNTFGFKKGRTTFSDQISQTIAGATASSTTSGTGTKGGTNAKQVGLGASVSSIEYNCYPRKYAKYRPATRFGHIW